MYNANDYQHLKSKFAKAKSNTQRDLIADQKRGSLKPKDSEKIIMNTLALQKRLSTQVVLPSQMGSEEANQLKL